MWWFGTQELVAAPVQLHEDLSSTTWQIIHGLGPDFISQSLFPWCSLSSSEVRERSGKDLGK